MERESMKRAEARVLVVAAARGRETEPRFLLDRVGVGDGAGRDVPPPRVRGLPLCT
jgi:hypothetical protein